MTGWDLFWAAYILVGVIIAMTAHSGYRTLYGKRMPLFYMVFGGILWPIVLLIAGRKK